MTISDNEKQELAKFLNSALYRRAKHQVLELTPIHVVGSDRSADNIALDLATKEGMSKAFADLEKLPLPAPGKLQPVTPTPLQKRPTE